MPKKVYYVEISFAPKNAKARWVRMTGGPFESFLAAQDAAIKNGERPYRIKTENAPAVAVAS